MKIFKTILFFLIVNISIGQSLTPISIGTASIKVGNSLLSVAFDTDAQIFFDTVEARGASLTKLEKFAVNIYVIHLKRDGVWNIIHADYPMVGSTAISCAVNLKNPGTFDITWVNTVAGDFTSTGWTPNGSTSYGRTGLIPSTTLGLTSASLEYYSRTSVLDEGGIEMGAQISNTQRIDLLIEFSDVIETTFACWGIVTDEAMFDVDNSQGSFIGSRIANNDTRLFRNGIQLDINTDVLTTTRPNVDVYLGARNNNGSADFFSTKECAGASISDGLTSELVLLQYNARQIMNTTLNREL